MTVRQRVVHWLMNNLKSPNDTRLMKMLFVTRIESQIENEIPFYDFVPYKFGPFSHVAIKDINLARKYNNDEIELPLEVENELRSMLERYGNFSTEKLLNYVYNSYPYFALFSEIKDKHLKSETKLPILKPIPTYLNSIHYEGRSIDEFLNILIRNKIDVLVDVRRNPLSMKYGFRKASLERYATMHNFKYLHIPELGIEKEKRDALDSVDDYSRIFKEYRSTTLRDEKEKLASIESLINAKKRIALFCFEKDIKCCHRVCIANDFVTRLNLPVTHL